MRNVPLLFTLLLASCDAGNTATPAPEFCTVEVRYIVVTYRGVFADELDQRFCANVTLQPHELSLSFGVDRENMRVELGPVDGDNPRPLFVRECDGSKCGPLMQAYCGNAACRLFVFPEAQLSCDRNDSCSVHMP